MMISTMLPPKSKILVDFDQTVVYSHDASGKLFYPEIGPLISGVKEFFEACAKNGVEIYIWTARANPIPHNVDETETPIHGVKGVVQVTKFLAQNNLIYKDFYLEYKPIHMYDFKYIIDDKAFNSIADFKSFLSQASTSIEQTR